MGESIERQAAEIRKRLAFLKMIERVLVTTTPAAPQEANPRIGNEAGFRNCLRNLAMIHMARCRVSPVTRISGSVSAVSRVWQGRIVVTAGSPPVWLAALR